MIALNTVLATYLLRRPLFESWLRTALEQRLGQALDAEVQLGAIEGSWVFDVHLRDLQIRNGGGVLASLEDGHLSARCAPVELATGALAGLRSVELRAASAEIRPGAGPDAPPSQPDVEPIPDLSWLDEIAPHGIRAAVDRLTLRTGDDVHETAALLELQPKPAAERGRTLRLQLGADRLELALGAGVRAGHGELRVADVGRLLPSLGLQTGLRGGQLRATVELGLDPAHIGGELQLRDASHRERRLQRTSITFSASADRIRVPDATVDLPGLRLRATGVELPADDGAVVWRTAAGTASVTVDDLSAYTDLLPAPLHEFLPLRGGAELRLTAGTLDIDQCVLHGRDARLAIRRGTIVLAADARQSSGELAVRLAFDAPRTIPIGADRGCTAQGLIEGTLRGSLDAPRIDADVNLAQLAVAGYALEGVRGRLRHEGSRTSATGVEIDAVRAAGATGDGSRLRGDLAFELMADGWRIETSELRGVLTPAILEGELREEWAHRLAAAPFAVRGWFRQRHDEWPELDAALALPNLHIAPHPPIALETAAIIDARGTLQLRALRARGGVHLDARGTVPLASDGLVDVHAAAHDLDLSSALAAAGLTVALEGRCDASVRLRGPRTAPTLQATVHGILQPPSDTALAAPVPNGPVDVELLVDGVPGVGFDENGLRLGTPQCAAIVRATGGDGAGAALCDARLDLRGDRTSVALTSLRVGPGAATGAATASGPWTALLQPEGLAPETPLTANLALSELDLGALQHQAWWPAHTAGLTVSGIATGEVMVAGSVGTPRSTFAIAIENGEVRQEDLPPLQSFTAQLRGTPTELEVRDGRATWAGGGLQFGGALRTTDASPLWSWSPAAIAIDGRASWTEGDVAALPAFFDGAWTAAGTATVEATITGTAAAPAVAGRAQIRDGHLAEGASILLDDMQARIVAHPDHIVLEQLTASSDGGALRGRARIEGGTDALLGGGDAWTRSTVDGILNLEEVPLATLLRGAQGVSQADGTVTGKATFAGPLASPRATARVHLRDGVLKLAQLPRLDGLNGTVELEEDRATLADGRGRAGAGEFQLTARAATTDGATLWNTQEPLELEAKLTGEDVLLYRARGVKVRANAALELKGHLEQMALSGTVGITDAALVRRIPLLPDLTARGGGIEASSGLRLPGIGAVGERIAVDVAVQTLEPFDADTNVLRAQLDAALRLRGTAAQPHLEGTISAQRGTLAFPGTKLRLDSLVLSFDADRPQLPGILLHANGRRHGIHVQMTVEGPYDEPEVVLTSAPAVPPQELVVLLTTGALPSTLRNLGPQGQATLLGSFLAEEIFYTYFGSDSTEDTQRLLDRFHIESGREVSSRGEESLLFEFDLDERLALQAERDVYEDFNMGVVYRIRF